MGATSSFKSGAGAELERPASGVYPARCVQVVELGTHDKEWQGKIKKTAEVLIVWELSELMEDGRPFVVNWRGTNSLSDKAHLFKMLNDWRGKSFTESELECFALGNILDKTCLLNVVTEKSKKNDKIYTNVKSIMPLAKGMNVINRVNDLVDFGITDLGTPVWDKLYPWVQKVIAEKSDEGKIFFKNKPLPERAKQADAEHEEENQDDIPF